MLQAPRCPSRHETDPLTAQCSGTRTSRSNPMRDAATVYESSIARSLALTAVRFSTMDLYEAPAHSSRLAAQSCPLLYSGSIGSGRCAKGDFACYDSPTHFPTSQRPMPRLPLLAALIALPIVVAAPPSLTAQDLKPPVATIHPKVDTLHGDVRTDNYFWIRNKEDPQVISYLEAENAYTSARMKHTEALQQKLYDEMLSRIKETDVS